MSNSEKRLGKLIGRRNELGLTQQDIALKTGCSVATICNIENGEVAISADKMLNLGKAYGIGRKDFGYYFVP